MIHRWKRRSNKEIGWTSFMILFIWTCFIIWFSVYQSTSWFNHENSTPKLHSMSRPLRGRGALYIMPTVPYLFKGVDSRVCQVIKYLTFHAQMDVTIAYFYPLSTEKMTNADDSVILKPIRDMFPNIVIYGPLYKIIPLDATNTKKSTGEPIELEGVNLDVDLVLYTIFESPVYVDFINRNVHYLQSLKGSIRVMPLCEDSTSSSRMLSSFLINVSRSEVETIVLSLRPSNLVADPVKPTIKEAVPKTYTHFLAMELENYQHVDVLAAITPAVETFIRRFVSGQRTDILHYAVSELPRGWNPPTKPHSSEFHIMFVGFQNPSNENSINWFVDNVMPLLSQSIYLHIVGHVRAKLCSHLRLPNVVCEGAKDNLEPLYRDALAAINPTMDKTSVSTKTCDALQRGVPVVTTTLDGVVIGIPAKESLQRYGLAICPPKDANCMADSIKKLTSSHQLWLKASRSGLAFIRDNFSESRMWKDLRRIINRLETIPFRVLVLGQTTNSASLLSTLQYNRGIEVHLIASSSSSVMSYRGFVYHRSIRAVPTGVDFHIVIDLELLPQPTSLPDRICHRRCRRVIWLTLSHMNKQYGNFPTIHQQFDSVWAADKVVARTVIKRGVTSSMVYIMPLKVDCPWCILGWGGCECHKKIDLVYFRQIQHILDRIDHTNGTQKAGYRHRLLAPSDLISLRGQFDLYSPNLKWRVETEHAAKLIIRHVETNTIRWSSPGKAGHFCINSCTLRFTENCQLQLLSSSGGIASETRAFPPQRGRRQQCLLSLDNNGNFSVIAKIEYGNHVLLSF